MHQRFNCLGASTPASLFLVGMEPSSRLLWTNFLLNYQVSVQIPLFNETFPDSSSSKVLLARISCVYLSVFLFFPFWHSSRLVATITHVCWFNVCSPHSPWKARTMRVSLSCEYSLPITWPGRCMTDSCWRVTELTVVTTWLWARHSSKLYIPV